MVDKGFTNDAIPALSACESPIEGKFVQAWFDLMASEWRNVEYSSSPESRCIASFYFDQDSPEDSVTGVPERYELSLQYSIRDCRVDAIVSSHGWMGGYGAVAVELDGRKFHSSEEQINNDRRKGRLLASVGLICIRYSGSEIFASAEDAAVEVKQIVTSLMYHNENLELRSWNHGVEAGKKLAKEVA